MSVGAVTTKEFAVYVITRGGAALAAQLTTALGEQIDVFYTGTNVTPLYPHWRKCTEGIRGTVATTFAHYRCHIMILSVGAAVRIIAPLIGDKYSDPAVVTIDDRGRYAIALLSGHVGGANRYAQLIAQAVGATAIITTASDLHNTIKVDLLGSQWGWKIDPNSKPHVTTMSGKMVAGQLLALVQLSGQRYSHGEETPLPTNVTYITNASKAVSPAGSYEGVMIVADLVDPYRDHVIPVHPCTVIYRPKTLVLGIGCDRGFPIEILQRVIAQSLSDYNLSHHSIKLITSIDKKADEPCLRDYCQRAALPFTTFSSRELGAVATPHPSARVLDLMGTPSVAEAAALLGACDGELVISKQKYHDPLSGKNMTLAVARQDFGNKEYISGK